MNTPIPTSAEETDDSIDVSIPSKKTAISTAVASAAARAAGLTLIDAKQLKAAGVFGEFISQVGAIHIGRSRLAMNIARADEAMAFCEKAANGAEDAETAIGLMKVFTSVLGESNKAAAMLIESAKAAAETAKTEAEIKLPGWGPQQPQSPQPPALTQINNEAGGTVVLHSASAPTPASNP